MLGSNGNVLFLLLFKLFLQNKNYLENFEL